jgi:hypothetical protein
MGPDYIIAGNKMYQKCVYCNELVRINKPIFGSMHLCVSEEVRKEINKINSLSYHQQHFKLNGLL